jgi:hypothetical protein
LFTHFKTELIRQQLWNFPTFYRKGNDFIDNDLQIQLLKLVGSFLKEFNYIREIARESK